jgi:hypothetical protein
MITQYFNIDGKQYKMFTLLICGDYMNVASYELDEKIVDMITEDRYHEVRHIDEMCGYYVDENIEENEKDIREHIEDVIYGDTIDANRIIIK